MNKLPGARQLGMALAVGSSLAVLGLAGIGSALASAQPIFNLPLGPVGTDGPAPVAPTHPSPSTTTHNNNHSPPGSVSSGTTPTVFPPYVPPSYIPPPTSKPNQPVHVAALAPPVYVVPQPVFSPAPPAYDPPPPAAPPPPPPPPATVPAALTLTDTTITQGGDLTATGQGCTPGAPVTLSVGDVAVGTAEADPEGDFATRLTTRSIDVGQHQVIAQCGSSLAAPLDVVLISRVGTSTSTVTVIVFFLLIGLWSYGHRLGSHMSAWRAHRRGDVRSC